MINLIQKSTGFGQKAAIHVGDKSFTYEQLLTEAKAFAKTLLRGQSDLQEARVAFMVPPGFEYVKTQWAIWLAGGIAVPLSASHPAQLLQYYLESTSTSIFVVHQVYADLVKDFESAADLLILNTATDNSFVSNTLPDISPDRKAMILFTSGTTNKPKGVVSTHAIIEAQVKSLVNAWEWSADDHILCVLPLHHIHGIINIISCALWSGATVSFASFSEALLFDIFKKGQVNLFMAVPTIYFKLISFYEKARPEEQQEISEKLKAFRLMVSGSAALPVSVHEKWKEISGHTLLERYGMTEIGMGISNPYHGERKPGYIGMPLPGVSVRLATDSEENVGEIQIKGPNVFDSYWNNPQATKDSFTEDGWFKTGDIAALEDGYYKILGRDSVDIIKSGGYKISALEIEEVMRTHPEVKDVAVIGLPDEEWGELIAAVIASDKSIDEKEMSAYIKERMPAYRCPRKYMIVKELPRNAMGKVLKPELKKLF